MDSKIQSGTVHEILLLIFDSFSEDHSDLSRKELYHALRSRLHKMTLHEMLRTFFVCSHDDASLLHPIEIFKALRSKTGQDIPDDIDAWMTWFLQTMESDVDHQFIHSLYKMHKTQRKSLCRLGKIE